MNVGKLMLFWNLCGVLVKFKASALIMILARVRFDGVLVSTEEFIVDLGCLCRESRLPLVRKQYPMYSSLKKIH
jgi:hypothetical protein